MLYHLYVVSDLVDTMTGGDMHTTQFITPLQSLALSSNAEATAG